MFLSLVLRLCALVVLLIGWDMTQGSGWKLVLGMIIFIIGVEAFDAACVRANEHRKMPYRWDCKICRKKGNPTGMKASDQRVIDAWRIDHNRTVHLLEP